MTSSAKIIEGKKPNWLKKLWWAITGRRENAGSK